MSSESGAKAIANTEEKLDPDFDNYKDFMDPLVGITSLSGGNECERIEITKSISKARYFDEERRLSIFSYRIKFGSEKVDRLLDPTYDFQAKITDKSYTYQSGAGTVSIKIKKNDQDRLQYIRAKYSLSDAEPTAYFSCGAPEENLDQTPKHDITLKNGKIVGKSILVRREVPETGKVYEVKYFIDNSSKLTWGSQTMGSYYLRRTHGGSSYRWSDLEKKCAESEELGLKWRVPTIEEFRTAFQSKNPDKSEFPYNKNLLEVFGSSAEHSDNRCLVATPETPITSSFSINRTSPSFYDSYTGIIGTTEECGIAGSTALRCVAP